ncbi:hypothetical protein BT67DRAFT_443637 [Trichocladium antarcticum]|uniref:Secreted protein n=1 Tax=Trichocladium antarcticum TaxID=1450529 RepID=A0AAN6UH62_9PEZI|nr:hypothetical protein BT67DRAFT_443637 [Trichocladium antarcticum]
MGRRWGVWFCFALLCSALVCSALLSRFPRGGVLSVGCWVGWGGPGRNSTGRRGDAVTIRLISLHLSPVAGSFV